MSETLISQSAKRLSDIAVELDVLGCQIKPVLDRIKELKRERDTLKTTLKPAMKESSISTLNSPAVKIQYKPDAQRKPPMNKPTIEAALDEFFKREKVPITGRAAVEFIDAYRYENKVAVESLVVSKPANYTSPNVTPVEPMRVANVATVPLMPTVKPFSMI